MKEIVFKSFLFLSNYLRMKLKAILIQHKMLQLFVKICSFLFLLSSCNSADTSLHVNKLSVNELDEMNKDISRYFLKEYPDFNVLSINLIDSWVFYRDKNIHFAWERNRICDKGYMPIKLNNYKNEKAFINEYKYVTNHLKKEVKIYSIYNLSNDSIRLSLKNKGGIILGDTIIL